MNFIGGFENLVFSDIYLDTLLEYHNTNKGIVEGRGHALDS